MNPDIVIVRDGDAYRLLHGHLRLASVTAQSIEVSVDVEGEGPVTVMKTHHGYLVGNGRQKLPLRGN